LVISNQPVVGMRQHVELDWEGLAVAEREEAEVSAVTEGRTAS
jgi:hypothetical protein